jgi:hypothetical protein
MILLLLLCFSTLLQKLLDYRSSPITKQLTESGVQFDVIFDSLGDQSLYHACPNFLIPSGQYWALTPDVGNFEGFWPFLKKSASLLANFWLPVWAGGVPRHYGCRSTVIKSAEMRKVVEIYEKGMIYSLISPLRFTYVCVSRAYPDLSRLCSHI